MIYKTGSRKKIQDRHIARRNTYSTIPTKRDIAGRYIKGNKSNPGGETLSYQKKAKLFKEKLLNAGLEAKLIERVFQTLQRDNSLSGKDLQKYLNIMDRILAILPKEQKIEGEGFQNIQVLVQKGQNEGK